MNEPELRSRAAIEELQLVIHFLTQRCINLKGDLIVQATKGEEDAEAKKMPLKVVE